MVRLMIDYSYAVAYVSAKETSVLSKEALLRMGSDGKDGLRQLSQTGYGGGDAESAGELVDRELSALRAFIKETLPDELASLLILPYDAHNLKVLLKCAVNGADALPYLYDNTMYDTEIAAACCRGGEFSLLSDDLAKILNPAYDAGTLSLPFYISALCDRAIYKEISKLSKSAPKPLPEYIAAKIDGKNLISYFRALRIGLDNESFGSLLLPGGLLDTEAFTEAYGSKADELRAYTSGLDMHFVFISACEAAKSSLSAAADILDNYAYSKLEPYKYEPQSVAPIFLYFKKKTAEARYVREAFGGKGGAV